ncbi:hypothetical protein [Chthonobacter rhizosphaerae]|uniref:hypothetical protein n=1 Tax=Chthonobacter rhizosphaerae TaxID=2735553 RepID=UPI0015EE8D88|nr:hypothetical protein [Chthonobacter rhizosphaerae]
MQSFLPYRHLIPSSAVVRESRAISRAAALGGYTHPFDASSLAKQCLVEQVVAAAIGLGVQVKSHTWDETQSGGIEVMFRVGSSEDQMVLKLGL